MILPTWFVKRYMPSGAQLSKFPIKSWLRNGGSYNPTRNWTPGVERPCAVCGKQVYVTFILGQQQLEGVFRGGEYFHRDHAPLEGSKPGDWRKQGDVDRNLIIPKGNLEEGEYRYWVGTRDISATMGICRACRFATYSREQRIAHQNDDSKAINGSRCPERLVKCYNLLLSVSTCIVCKGTRHIKGKWGVPICKAPLCEIRWKFDLERYISLEAQLAKMRRRATVAISPDTTGVESLGRIWCSQCQMFEDNVNHNETHAQWQSMWAAEYQDGDI